MAAGSDVRQGRAYVELYVKNSALVKGLAAAKRQLQTFGAGVQSIGAWMMGVGAAIVSPMILATKHFMDAGSALNDMSARTGLSTNALFELGFAAEQTGSNMEEVEKGVRKMQKTIMDAASGEKTYVDALRMVGTSYAELQGLSPEKQFERIAEGINAIQDPTMKAASAVEIFGRSGTNLLPMIGDMKALRAEAVRLGLSIGPEQAAAADALGDSWDACKASLKAVAVAIGSSLAPMLTGLSEKIKEGLQVVREWSAANRSLIVTAFGIGTSAIAAGSGLFLLGKAIALVGGAIGAVMAVGSAMAASFAFMKTVVLLLMNPVVALGLAAVALGGYFLYASGAASKAAAWISQTFASLLGEVTETFGIIADAMAAGDFVSAAKVGWALVKMEWQKGVAFLSGLWEGFKGLYDEAVSGLAIGMVNASAQIQTIWADLLNWMSKKWAEFGTSAFTEALAGWIAPIVATLSGLKTEDVQKALAEDFAAARGNQGKQFAGMDAETEARKRQIEADRAAQVDSIGGDLARRNAERDARAKAAQDEVVAARAAWEAAKRSAADATAERQRKKAGAAAEFGGADSPAALSAVTTSTAGTFSARGAMQMGAGNVQDRIARAVEKSEKQGERLIKLSEKTVESLRGLGNLTFS